MAAARWAKQERIRKNMAIQCRIVPRQAREDVLVLEALPLPASKSGGLHQREIFEATAGLDAGSSCGVAVTHRHLDAEIVGGLVKAAAANNRFGANPDYFAVHGRSGSLPSLPRPTTTMMAAARGGASSVGKSDSRGRRVSTGALEDSVFRRNANVNHADDTRGYTVQSQPARSSHT